ncbi:MAG TPA: hypothetical protein VMO20_10225 [Candidatus Acidoferrum sp.]|nr:hypothetical protein [Candidatus Acidoferrum sp.]
MTMITVAILFVVIFAIASIYSMMQAAKRREGLLELAQRLNLNFNPDQDCGIPGQFAFLKQFDQGENRYATNVLSGAYQQNEVLAFDYHYETVTYDKDGRHVHHHWFSFFILTIPAVFPDLTIRREGLFTKIAEVFGYQNIKFESAEFSKTFCVRSPDKKFAYDVCNAIMMEYLLVNRDLSIEIENQVVALVFNNRISVDAFENNLQRLVEIRSHLPEYLFTQRA